MKKQKSRSRMEKLADIASLLTRLRTCAEQVNEAGIDLARVLGEDNLLASKLQGLGVTDIPDAVTELHNAVFK